MLLKNTVSLHRYNKYFVRKGMLCMKLNLVMRNAGLCVHLAAVHSSILN